MSLVMTEEKNDRKFHIIFLKKLQPAMFSLCACVCECVCECMCVCECVWGKTGKKYGY